MPISPDRIRQLRERRDEFRTALAQAGDLRPAPIVERYRRCGKPNCHCVGEALVVTARRGR
jgi:hypothetical protein